MHDGVPGIEDMHNFDAADTQHIRDQRVVAAPPYRFRALSAVRRRPQSSSSSSRPWENSALPIWLA